jgi:hypothetical protein
VTGLSNIGSYKEPSQKLYGPRRYSVSLGVYPGREVTIFIKFNGKVDVAMNAVQVVQIVNYYFLLLVPDH